MRSAPATNQNAWTPECEWVQEDRHLDEWNYWPIDIDRHLRDIKRLVATAHQTPSDTEKRWLAYLKSLPVRQLASTDVAAAALQLWENLTEVAPISSPDASPTNDEGLLMSWDRDGHHLEVEILKDATYEWFYRHRVADVSEGDAVTSVDEIPAALAECMKRLLA